MNTSEMTWHDDGHRLIMQINKTELKILSTTCPNKDKSESSCRHPDAECMVDWFISRFGLECNVGVCSPLPELEVAWSFIGDTHREIEAGQIWVIPKNDEAFSAWLISQMPDEQEEETVF